MESDSVVADSRSLWVHWTLSRCECLNVKQGIGDKIASFSAKFLWIYKNENK